MAARTGARACPGPAKEMSRLVRDEQEGAGRPRNPNRPRGDSDV